MLSQKYLEKCQVLLLIDIKVVQVNGMSSSITKNSASGESFIDYFEDDSEEKLKYYVDRRM